MNLLTKLWDLRKNQNSDSLVYKTLLPLVILSLIACAIWFVGPNAAWKTYAPLAAAERRIYFILLIFLAFVLKILIIDLDIPHPFQYQHKGLRKKTLELQKRFQGAARFLDKNSITTHGKKTKLGELPAYLLIGPANAGKTSLLIHSGVHFILQKNFQHDALQHPDTSESCDWWVTREASIIDVPGKYISSCDGVNITPQQNTIYSALWMFFLRLMKKKRGKNGINGIIIALPASEIIQHQDNKNYSVLIRDLFQRIKDVQKLFTRPVLCQLVITKCDLLPGFKEFFAETSTEEMSQIFGVTLPAPKANENITDLFNARFNGLIKNLNQQLLFRLHQERNPMVRPAVKDFPLQMERIKEFSADFIKKLSIVRLNAAVKGVYLTSAAQPATEAEMLHPSIEMETDTRVIQIFKEPINNSHAYFIKQFLTQGIHEANAVHDNMMKFHRLKIRTAYAASAGLIALVTAFLCKDFQQGVKQGYLLQQHLADYHHQITQIQNPAEQLIDSIHLLDTLQQSIKPQGLQFDLSSLLSIYSHQSERKATDAYYAALNHILLPEIKNYVEEYLQNPVNKNGDDIYAALKAYLMLGDTAQFDGQYIVSTLQGILPKALSKNESASLAHHLTICSHSSLAAITLDHQKIESSRKYLNAIAPVKLSFIILKNMDSNNAAAFLGTEKINNTIFSNESLSQIPAMFTGKMFNMILTQQVEHAAKESYTGNWILGNAAPTAVMDPTLPDQLRIRYVSQYVETWENLLENTRLIIPHDLAATDALIVSLISNDSPLLHLLKIVRDNTNFEPITIASPKLQRIIALVDKTQDSQQTLYNIFASMQSLHQYLQNILHAEDVRQAAYDAVSNRMANRSTPDAITQLRVIAENCPTPVRQWLVRITDNSWSYLMQEAGQYLDVSWNTQVMPYYRSEIAGRFPFNSSSDQEVSFQKFTKFFGNPGVVVSFYNKYLQRFVDTSTADWHWKQIDSRPIPFSVETLRQIQYAMRIHNAFFPKGDDRLYVQFALQPYKFGKLVKSVRLSFNDEQFTDIYHSKNTHLVTLQGNNMAKMTSVQLTLHDQQIISRQYKGSWGWFKMLNQSFESVLTKRNMLLNLSMNQHPAKYILSAEGQYNPLLSLNLQLFHLPQQVTDEKA
jgi:type VI secretion system protein ImpL